MIDDAIGRVLAKLAADGLTNDTVVIFDNLRQTVKLVAAAFVAATPDFQTTKGYEIAGPGQANLSMSTAQLAERFGQLTHRDTEFAVKTILEQDAASARVTRKMEAVSLRTRSPKRRSAL